MVDGHAGNIAGGQLRHLCGVEIGADQAHAVHITVAAVLQVSHAVPAHIMVDEGNIVTMLFAFALEGIQHGGEEAVGQAVVPIVGKEYAQVAGAVGLEGAGDGVGKIADFPGGAMHQLAGFAGDIAVIVEGLADCGYGQPAPRGYVLNRHCHSLRLPVSASSE